MFNLKNNFPAENNPNRSQEMEDERCLFCEREEGYHSMWCPNYSQNGDEAAVEFLSGYESGARMEKYPVEASEVKQKGWQQGYNDALSNKQE